MGSCFQHKFVLSVHLSQFCKALTRETIYRDKDLGGVWSQGLLLRKEIRSSVKGASSCGNYSSCLSISYAIAIKARGPLLSHLGGCSTEVDVPSWYREHPLQTWALTFQNLNLWVIHFSYSYTSKPWVLWERGTYHHNTMHHHHHHTTKTQILLIWGPLG